MADDLESKSTVPYEAPSLTVHGSLAEVTSASFFGTNADQNIPAGSSIVGKTSF